MDVRRRASAAGALVPSREKDAAEGPLTEADLAADALITAALRRCFPDDGLVSEESAGALGGAELCRLLGDGGGGPARVWVVDPLDGAFPLAGAG